MKKWDFGYFIADYFPALNKKDPVFRVITTSDITLKLPHITSQMDKGTCKVAMLTEKAQNSSN